MASAYEFVIQQTQNRQGYLRSPGLRPKNLPLLWKNVSEVDATEKFQLSVSSHCLVQCLTQYCDIVLARSVVWPTAPCSALQPVTGGHLKCISVDQWALTLFLACLLCLPRCWWDSTTPNCYDLVFFFFLFFCVVFGSFAFHVFLSCSLRMSLWSV